LKLKILFKINEYKIFDKDKQIERIDNNITKKEIWENNNIEYYYLI
jgi:hypothetical protein